MQSLELFMNHESPNLTKLYAGVVLQVVVLVAVSLLISRVTGWHWWIPGGGISMVLFMVVSPILAAFRTRRKRKQL